MSIEDEIRKSEELARSRRQQNSGQSRADGPHSPSGQITPGVADRHEAEKADRIERHPAGPESFAPRKQGK